MVALVGLAVGIMVPVSMAIQSGASLTGTAGVGPVEPSLAVASPAGGAVATPTPAPTSTRTPKPNATAQPRPTPAPQATPDERRPLITSRTPAPDATGVVAGSAIQVQFSEPVRGVSGATIQLVNVAGGWTVRSTVRYDAASRMATLTPARHMYPVTQYRVEILPGITDRSGNRLEPQVWTFRVAR